MFDFGIDEQASKAAQAELHEAAGAGEFDIRANGDGEHTEWVNDDGSPVTHEQFHEEFDTWRTFVFRCGCTWHLIYTKYTSQGRTEQGWNSDQPWSGEFCDEHVEIV